MSAREPGARAAGSEGRLLFFHSAGERFAIDVAYVREILPARETTPVPFVPETVAGIINHRGTIYTLVSFARLAGLGPETAGGVVLLRLPEMTVGLTVGGIERIEALPERLLAPAESGATAPPATFLRRTSDGSGRLVHTVDAEILIDVIYQLPELAQVDGA